MTEDPPPPLPPQLARTAAARHRADLARNDFFATVSEIKIRLKPSNLARRAADSAVEEAAVNLEKVRKIAQSHPAETGAAATAAALITAWFVRDYKRKGTQDDDDTA